MNYARRIAFISIAAAALAATTPASADVSKDYARDTWDHGKCRAPFPYEDKLVTGDITGDGKSDAVMLWTCSSGAGGAQPRILSYWVDGKRIKQKSLMTPLPQAAWVKIRKGRVIVKGGTYSGVGVPLCCPDVKVTLTYKWNGRKLVLIDQKERPR